MDRNTRQRQAIRQVFEEADRPLGPQEVVKASQMHTPGLGIATVYRTLALFTQSGLATELDFGDGQKRYEHKYMHSHHDHMICTECGKIIEFNHPMIEKLQKEIAAKHGFNMTSHKLDLFGICGQCK